MIIFHPNKRIRNYILQKENETFFRTKNIIYHYYILSISWQFFVRFTHNRVFSFLAKSIIRRSAKNRSSISSILILLDMKLHWPHTHRTQMHRKRRSGDGQWLLWAETRICWTSESFCSFKRWAKQCCGLLTSKALQKQLSCWPLEQEVYVYLQRLEAAQSFHDNCVYLCIGSLFLKKGKLNPLSPNLSRL